MSSLIEWLVSVVFVRLFAFSPDVYSDKGLLVARTGWKANVFSIGFAGRSVTLDRNREMIRLRKRWFWFVVTTRYISFASVKEVLYGYTDVDPFQSFSWAHLQDDLFSVGVKLRTGEEIRLFRFYGQGDFSNDGPFPDWFFWDEILESKLTKGSQEGHALIYAEVVSVLVGVPIGSFTD